MNCRYVALIFIGMYPNILKAYDTYYYDNHFSYSLNTYIIIYNF